MSTDDGVAATNPYPHSIVEELPLQAASHELMEEIMTTPTTATGPRRPVEPSHRRRWLLPVVAAASVAALVAGTVAVWEPDSGSGPAPHGPAADPGLPPTADNLQQVVVGQDGWTVTYMDNAQRVGSVSWEKGKRSLELNWYKAEDYDSYLRDRRADSGKGEPVSLLGQDGEAFETKVSGTPRYGLIIDKDLPRSGDKPDTDVPSPKGPSQDQLRVMTILPPVGDRFLEFDAFVKDRDEYRALVDSLRRVDRRTWLDSLDGAVVQPGEGATFLEEAGRGVPMPPGVEVTPEDLNLPQDPYQARTAFVVPVMCGWAEEYVGGDDAALGVLEESADWPVMDAMAVDGDFPSVFRSDVRMLARNRDYGGWRMGWGC